MFERKRHLKEVIETKSKQIANRDKLIDGQRAEIHQCQEENKALYNENKDLRFNNEELSELAVEEIQHIMRFSAKPEWVRINRLIHCMPQYNVGHRAGIKAVREHVAENYPNLHLIGTPFDGIGIPDGVKQAKELVQTLVNDK